MFTLSTINAFLNVVVIAVFMQNEVIVLYGADGGAYKYGSRWFYLLFVCVPWLISGALFIKEVLNRKKSVQTEQSTESNDEPTDVIDTILIQQDENGIDMEDRIVKLKTIIPSLQ